MIASFLFNWPSTAGGIVHTVELGKFLRLAGYDVTHVFARFAPWKIGQLDDPLETPVEVLEFSPAGWTAATIQSRFRTAVRKIDPDAVIITDSWNFKPLLAEAVSEFPYILRQQALECLCPLNNLRLFPAETGLVQCPYSQLANVDKCKSCLRTRAGHSGSLHQAERQLAGVGTTDYDSRLRNILREAHAVLVLNPRIEVLMAPYSPNVRVATWGMDPARFTWPRDAQNAGETKTIFMAGLIEESIKGFRILHEACARLWRQRQDFRLLATGEPAGPVDEFTQFTGWLSQAELPSKLAAADIVAMPTIAQEGLARSTVEAMGVGRPVVASRIGGVPSTVEDGVTGLLFRPGDAADLAEKLSTLLDGDDMRQEMGLAGRKRFEADFLWPTVIERDYRPLLDTCRRTAA